MQINITCGNNLPNTDKIILSEVIVSGCTLLITIDVNQLDSNEVLIFDNFESFVNNQSLFVIENSPITMSVSIITPDKVNEDVQFIDFNDLIDSDKEKILLLHGLILSKLD